MRHLSRAIVLIAAALVIPILPFVVFGERFEAIASDWTQDSSSPGTAAVMIAVLLATDVLLPVPSSAVSTFGGAKLGLWPAAAASWSGMTLGAVLGFALAWVCGRPLARRLAGPEDFERMEVLSTRFGPLVLVLTRALPVLAEASVLLMGATRLGWRRFLVPVALSNLGIALAYSALGSYAVEVEALPIALAASVALPLLATFAARRFMRGPPPGDPLDTSPPAS